MLIDIPMIIDLNMVVMFLVSPHQVVREEGCHPIFHIEIAKKGDRSKITNSLYLSLF